MKSDEIYLRHISDAIHKIESYVAVGYEIFLTTSHWQDAVVRQLEIIGEATKRLSEDFRRHHNQIPCQRIAGLRDVLIHDYMGVDMQKVWIITQNELPQLKMVIEQVLKD